MAILAVLLAVLTLPVVLTNRGGTSESYDQRTFHMPVIQTMVDQWPDVDLVWYKSATAPGYHLFMAAVLRSVSEEVRVLQVINLAMGMTLILGVYWFAARLAGAAWGVALTMPVLLSKYQLSGSIWLTTDNTALTFVVLSVGTATFFSLGRGRIVVSQVCSAAAVGIRQIHIWSTGPLFVRAVLASPLGRLLPESLRDGDAAQLSWGRAVMHVLGAVPALIVLGWLIVVWDGLMPPEYRHLHNTGANYATFAFALSLIAMFGTLMVPAVWREGNWRLVLRDPLVRAALLVGAAVGVIWPTSFDKDAGRWGGYFWALVDVAPDVADRSLLLLFGAAVGAAVLAVLYRAAERSHRGREAVTLLLTGLGFLLAQSFNSQSGQRYYELILLIGLIWLVALGRNGMGQMSPSDRRAPWRWMPLVALVIIQAMVSIATVYWPALTRG